MAYFCKFDWWELSLIPQFSRASFIALCEVWLLWTGRSVGHLFQIIQIVILGPCGSKMFPRSQSSFSLSSSGSSWRTNTSFDSGFDSVSRGSHNISISDSWSNSIPIWEWSSQKCFDLETYRPKPDTEKTEEELEVTNSGTYFLESLKFGAEIQEASNIIPERSGQEQILEYRRRRKARKMANKKIVRTDTERKDFETVLKELDTVLALEERKKSVVSIEDGDSPNLVQHKPGVLSCTDKEGDDETKSVYMVFETEDIRKSRKYGVNSLYKM